jgi:hypothetical protein
MTARPTPPEVEAALSRLDLGEARLIVSTVVGSWADQTWRAGDDVDVRAVYAFEPEAYLGIRSFRDEIELVAPQGSGWELDLVAFEVEKAARLLLKGHQPTRRWLTPLLEAAGMRDPDYDRLDDWVRSVRMGKRA